MTCKRITFLGCAAVALSAFTVLPAFAEGENAAEAEAVEEEKIDPALQAEVDYVEALVDSGFPDFAETVIAATKKKWPESDAMFFAIEIRGLLSLGKFEEAEKRIAALPDRNGSKYWAARLEVANNFFVRGKKKDCSAIYDEFFKKFQKPPKELRQFYLQACYSWGQILTGDRRFDEATKTYERLLKLLNPKTSDDDANIWCNVACETAEMYIHLASDPKKAAGKAGYIKSAKKLVDKLLWERERAVYFGRAIAMKAHLELLGGSIAKAQSTIDDYMDQLAQLHEAIVAWDPDGRKGVLRQSPMPMCRYMLADMLWREAQDEAKKPKKDDDRIKALMFGEKDRSGKRNGAGAYNHALNVFIKYPESSWAAQAGELAETVRAFAEKTYGAKIKANITPEQIKKVRQMQFKGANEKLAEGNYEGAIAEYSEALSRYPEGLESVQAVENMIMAYLNRSSRTGDKEKKKEWRIDADAIEGYLSERFAGNRNRQIMTMAGDAVLRIAAVEKQRGEIARSDRLYKAFLLNYRQHVNAPTTAAALAGEAQKAERYADAIALWEVLDKYYTNSTFYTTALFNLAVCHEKLGERAAAIEAMGRYCGAEKNQLKKTQAQMQLAMWYQKDGLEILGSAETNATEEAVSAQLAKGSAQIIRGIKQFKDFADRSDKALGDPGTPPGEKKQYSMLKEGALYLIGDCWSRMTKPADKLEGFRKQAIASFEEYVKQYPKGKYAKAAYVKLGTMCTVVNDVDGCKRALDALSREFPDSDEAKNAKPRIAKILVEMGMRKEGTAIYAEMLKLDGNYTAGQFVNAGEALIEARSWDLADQAFSKAIDKAGTNQMSTVARARIGQAKALYKQNSLAGARDQLDQLLGDDKMSRLAVAADANLLLVKVASEQGRTEKDDDLRKKHFGAAIGALKKLRTYWKSKPQHEQDAIDLMSADVTISRMNAEDAMDLKEQAIASCERAASTLQGFVQTHGVRDDAPFDKMSPGEVANLERCYTAMVPLYARLSQQKPDEEGRKFAAAYVLKYGGEYLDLFPNGKARTEIQNCINQANAVGASVESLNEGSQAPAEPAEAAQASGDKGSEGEKTNE